MAKKYIRAYSTNRSADAKQKESSYKRAYKAKKTLKPKKKRLGSLKALSLNITEQTVRLLVFKVSYTNFITLFLKVQCSFAVVVINCGTDSVNSAHKLTKSNPSVDKYLLNKTSVDNTEWICISCGKYLIKNKVPPCAAVNLSLIHI